MDKEINIKNLKNNTMKKLLFLVILFSFTLTEITAQVCTSCYQTINTGTNSSAIGTYTVSDGNSSFASGYRSEASSDYTIALGFYSFATNAKSTAIGSSIKANASKSIVFGSGEFNANVYLENNVPRSLMVGFRSKYPTLFVSESKFSPEYDKTGKIGIGNITSPQAKLHLLADEGEDATVFQPFSWDNGGSANLVLGNYAYGLSSTKTGGLVFGSENGYSFANNGLVSFSGQIKVSGGSPGRESVDIRQRWFGFLARCYKPQ